MQNHRFSRLHFSEAVHFLKKKKKKKYMYPYDTLYRYLYTISYKPITRITTTMDYLSIYLTLSILLTETDSFASSVDPEEMAHNESSHLDPHSVPVWSCF